jgi:hypothetical protein
MRPLQFRDSAGAVSATASGMMGLAGTSGKRPIFPLDPILWIDFLESIACAFSVTRTGVRLGENAL